MSRQHIVDQLARHIEKTLSEGFELDPDTMHFLHSSFSIDQFEDLELLSKNGYEDELETILNLVVSPDLTAMRAVESFLTEGHVDSKDENRLIQSVSKACPQTRIAFPGDTRFVEVELSQAVLERFIRNFNMVFTFPDQVQKVMAERLTAPVLITARVLLRHSRWVWSDERIDFLSLFFSYASHDERQMLDDLGWVIPVLDVNLDGKSIRDVLVHCYHDYRKRLGELEAIEEMVKKNTMETLMLQGVRIPSITSETLQCRIDTVQRILASVYAWIDGPGASPSDIDLGDFTGKDGMKKILGLLS